MAPDCQCPVGQRESGKFRAPYAFSRDLQGPARTALERSSNMAAKTRNESIGETPNTTGGTPDLPGQLRQRRGSNRARPLPPHPTRSTPKVGAHFQGALTNSDIHFDDC